MLIKIVSTVLFFLFITNLYVRDDLTDLERAKVKKVTTLTNDFSKAERSEALSGGAGTVNKIGKMPSRIILKTYLLNNDKTF